MSTWPLLLPPRVGGVTKSGHTFQYVWPKWPQDKGMRALLHVKITCNVWSCIRPPLGGGSEIHLPLIKGLEKWCQKWVSLNLCFPQHPQPLVGQSWDDMNKRLCLYSLIASDCNLNWNPYDSLWLHTLSRITICINIYISLQVPTHGYMYILQETMVLMLRCLFLFQSLFC